MWHGSFRTFRSCWRRCANVCVTFTICRRCGICSDGWRAARYDWSKSRPRRRHRSPTPCCSITSDSSCTTGTALAERRAAALSLDSSLLAELLGRVELRELLDATVIEQTERELQRLTPERLARDAEGLADLLRLLGPLTAAEAAQRCVGVQLDDAEPTGDPAEWFAGLVKSKRALEVTFAGRTWWVAVEDAARLRDALGVPLPIGTPAAFIEPVADPLGDLVGRYARTHGPFTTEAVAARFGLGTAVAATALHRLVAEKRVVEGEFTPAASGSEWCDSQVLRRLRRRSLAAARHEVEPVATAAFGRFLPSWQHIGTGELRGVDGVAAVVEQLAGVPIPASAWESLVLPARVRDYSPAMLDELMATGEVVWSGHGAITAKDGWIALHLADQAPFTLTPADEIELSEVHLRLLNALGASIASWTPIDADTEPGAGSGQVVSLDDDAAQDVSAVRGNSATPGTSVTTNGSAGRDGSPLRLPRSCTAAARTSSGNSPTPPDSSTTPKSRMHCGNSSGQAWSQVTPSPPFAPCSRVPHRPPPPIAHHGAHRADGPTSHDRICPPDPDRPPSRAAGRCCRSE